MKTIEIPDGYYVPNLSEFHIGFRFEKYDLRLATYKENNYKPSNWHKHVYNIRSIRLFKVDMHLRDNTIIAKSLDINDIEELGWIRQPKDDRMYHLAFDNGECSLYFEKGEEIVITSLHEKVKNFDKVIFNGHLKNYNELKDQMNKLDIPIKKPI